jgi:hypothetical protein
MRLMLVLLLLVGCGGGDPEPVEEVVEIVTPPPKDICGPERMYCL